MRKPTLLSSCLFTLITGSSAWGVGIDWLTVGAPGNACDLQSQGCFGGVGYTYRISKYETTNAQYLEFLNAVAASDSTGLYHGLMASADGGITRSGTSGSFSYAAIAGRENKPVNFVSWYDALRFSNWLHNGQPVGAQDGSTTEGGAYEFSGPTSVGARNGTATIFLTNEDEWYKAAYYDALSTSYFDYPAGSDTPTTCAFSGPTPNTASCAGYEIDRAAVGSYTGSASPYGTFDQGGNVFEWNEATSSGSDRGLRGGHSDGVVGHLASSNRYFGTATNEVYTIGFRVASIPEPTTALLVMTGLLALKFQRSRSPNRARLR